VDAYERHFEFVLWEGLTSDVEVEYYEYEVI